MIKGFNTVKSVVIRLNMITVVTYINIQLNIFCRHVGQFIICCLSLLVSVGHCQLFLDILPQMVGRLHLPAPQ